MISATILRNRAEQKYETKKKVLINGYMRAVKEKEIHEKQKDYKKYHKLLLAYGDGVDEYVTPNETMKSVRNVHERVLRDRQQAEAMAAAEAEQARQEMQQGRSQGMNH